MAISTHIPKLRFIVVALIVALSCLSMTTSASAAPAAACPAHTHIIYSGTNTGCEVDGQAHANVYWAYGGRTLAVVGVGYRLYYAEGNGPFHELSSGVAGTAGGGVFWETTVVENNGAGPLYGHFRVLGSNNVTRYCIDFGQSTAGPQSAWYTC
jgi:hypothetical protein